MIDGPMPALGFGRDVALVARYELAEAVRSRLLLVMVLLFVGAGGVAAWSFSELVQSVEDNTARVTGAPTARRPGATMRRIRESGSYRQGLRIFLRDDQKADYFAAIPPIVTFFAYFSFYVLPFLVLFTSADTISTEVASRSIRYAVLRTGRLEFALGKAVGQALIVVGVTALAAVVFFAIAWASLAAFEPGATALGLMAFWPRVLLYLLPFLAWALFASMVTAGVNAARAVSLGGGVALSIVAGLVATPPRWLQGGAVFSTVRDLFGYLTPFGHYKGLAYPPGGALAGDVVVCLALTALYFAAGFSWLRKRDL
jgi:ABC-type transport system involved in multi-copper enzyme maturation permease subunit